MVPKVILLVEDNPADAEVTLAALAEYHLVNTIVVVEDGAEALDFLFRGGKYQNRDEGNPILVLLDLTLPKVDGREVLRRIKADDSLRSVPVVMLTDSPPERACAEGEMLAANACIAKPVAFTEFIKAVKELGLYWTLINDVASIDCSKR